MLGFIIWSSVGVLIICIGISAFFSKKVMGFWANIKPIEVSNLKKYNYAVGKLFCVYGIVFILLGMPMLKEQTTPFILLSILGVMLETILAMAVYTLIIEKKYKKAN